MTMLILALITVLVPLVVLLLFAMSHPKNGVDWAIHVMLAGTLIILFYLVAPWVFWSYYLRFAAIGAFLILTVRSYVQLRRRALTPWRLTTGGLARMILVLLLVTLDAAVVSGHRNPGSALDIAFPLKNGTYCIIQGGSNTAANFFHHFIDSEYAVDIVKLNRVGNRGRGIAPKELEDYEIYGATLYSPCDGTIHTVVNSIDDNIPPRANSIVPLGNHLIISSGPYTIILAHLMKDTFQVREGDIVKTGQALARVGNSGYSNEPHLHIQALRRASSANVMYGEPVAFTMDGRFVAINDLVTHRGNERR